VTKKTSVDDDEESSTIDDEPLNPPPAVTAPSLTPASNALLSPRIVAPPPPALTANVALLKGAAGGLRYASLLVVVSEQATGLPVPTKALVSKETNKLRVSVSARLTDGTLVPLEIVESEKVSLQAALDRIALRGRLKIEISVDGHTLPCSGDVEFDY